MTATQIVTVPAAEPISTAEAKSHLRVEHADDNTLIDSLVVAARQKVEHDTWRALVTQTWDYFLDAFPVSADSPIVVPRAPLASVTTVKYTDADGSTVTTLNAANYYVDTASEPGRIQLQDGEVWPADELRPANGVEVRFVAGYGAAGDVPQALKQLIYLLVGHWYENREASISEVSITDVPLAYWALMWQYRGWAVR